MNARHLKQVPGRKSDIRDCQWIAQLLQHGLLKGSFIPPRAQRELRDLTRHRVQLVEEKGRTVNRLHKVLEDANIKLASVATDILGVSGRAMLKALIEGQENPVQLADLAQRQLRGKKRALIAVGHSILVILYHLLKSRTRYADLGGDFFDRFEPQRLTRYFVRRLETLGHKVTLETCVAT